MNEIETDSLIEMENYCKSRFEKKYFIPNNSRITYEQIVVLRKIKKETSIKLVADCFEPSTKQNKKCKYLVDVACKNCGVIHKKEVTKTNILDIINDKVCYICEDCENLIAQKNREKNREQEENYKKHEEENTKYYIENYLNPNKAFIKIEDGFKYLRMNCNFEKVSDYINNMSYKDFLNTPYWRAIAYHKKRRAGFRCELCNSKGVLCVHHKTYNHHGAELYNLNDLIVLCSDCHEKFHDIERGE